MMKWISEMSWSGAFCIVFVAIIVIGKLSEHSHSDQPEVLEPHRIVIDEITGCQYMQFHQSSHYTPRYDHTGTRVIGCGGVK